MLCDDGITAELWLGALVDAGAPLAELQAAIDRAGVPTQILAPAGDAREVVARFVRFETAAGAARYDTVEALRDRIDAADLPDRAHARAHAVADGLARAEAASHGVPIEDVRFHELGRPHGVARIIAGAAALESLEVDRVTVGPIAVGGGVIRIAHGRFSVPPPAVLHLLRGFVIRGGDLDEELTTPSGAAVLAGLATSVERIPAMRLETHGRGAMAVGEGHRLLTVVLGTS